MIFQMMHPFYFLFGLLGVLFFPYSFMSLNDTVALSTVEKKST